MLRDMLGLPSLEYLTVLVKSVAHDELMPRFKHTRHWIKQDGSVVTEADFAVQQRLLETLQADFPHFAFLSEEMDEKEQHALLRNNTRGIWYLDPVDGTSNYAAGLPLFCISLALVIENLPVLAIVYDPIREECFSAQRGKGAWLNGVSLRCMPVNRPLSSCVAIVDFKRLQPHLASALIENTPYSSHRYLGSGALEWCWLADGRFQVYLHGRQKPWDYAAGVLILFEAGGFSETLRGEKVFTTGMTSRSVIASTDKVLFDAWREAIRHLSGYA